MLKNRNILIVGGAGFIGSHVADGVNEAGGNLCIADDLSNGSQENIAHTNAPFFECDCSDSDVVERICKENHIDTICNLATLSLPMSLRYPLLTFQKTVRVTESLCELQRLGIFDTLMHFSSSEVYGNTAVVPMEESHPINPTTPYAAAKAACDHLVLSYYRTFGCRSNIIRPFNQYGPREHIGEYSALIPRVIEAVSRNEPIQVYGTGQQRRDLLYVTDLVHAVVKWLAQEEGFGDVIHIASGEDHSVLSIIDLIVDSMGKPATIQHKDHRSADISLEKVSIAKAKNLLSWEPSISFQEGIEKTIQWHTS